MQNKDVMLLFILYLLLMLYEDTNSKNSGCSNYQFLKQQHLENVLPDEYIKDSQDSLTKILNMNDQRRGQTFSIRGRTYFESSFKSTFAEAAETCFLRRMELLAFDEKYELEHKFFTRGLNSKIYQADQNYLWTSGVPCSKNHSVKSKTCKKVTWCPTKVVTDVKPIYTKDKKKVKNGLCLTFERWTGRFLLQPCDLQFYFICEVLISKFSGAK